MITDEMSRGTELASERASPEASLTYQPLLIPEEPSDPRPPGPLAAQLV